MERAEVGEMLGEMASSMANGLGIVGPVLIVFLGWLELIIEIMTTDERWVKNLLDCGQEIGGS